VPIPSVIERWQLESSQPIKYATMADDAAFVQKYLIDLVEEQNKDVIIVAHSYSGVVATEAIKGFSKKEREANGLSGKGGVTDVIYVASLVPPVGGTASSLMGGGFPSYIIAEVPDALATAK
jgi:hypothetical protein